MVPQDGDRSAVDARVSETEMAEDQDESQAFEIVDDAEEEVDADAEAVAQLEARQQAEREHLNQRHIKAVTLEKRAIYRKRTYMLVLGVACIVGILQACWLAIGEARGERWLRVASLLTIAIGLSLAPSWFFRRAREYRIEAERTSLPEPETPPDFSTLSDGSQFAKNLENLDR